MHATHEEQRLRLRVRQMRWEAEGVLSLELGSTDGSPLPAWAPGAHLDLLLPGTITRQYSLCGSCDSPTAWRIAVLREPVSRGGSAAVHEVVRPGDVVDVVGPRNNFSLVEAPGYLFIAGGIGITPLVPMIEQAAATDADWRLVYGGRTRASMAFVDELAERYGDRVTVVPQDEHGLLDLEALLGTPLPDTLVYCCGPEPLLAAVESHVAAAWPPASLHVERFAPKPQEAADPEGEIEFDVVLQQSGATVTVPAGMSILEALEANGIDAPNSCREGICGTCEVAVVEGVPEHRDSLLSEEERAANETVMICVGRALCPKLVLDL
jgi:ferredoxin-NADP reductase